LEEARGQLGPGEGRLADADDELFEVVGQLGEGGGLDGLDGVVVEVETLDAQALEVVGAEVGDVVAGEDELFVEDGAARELGQVGELLAGAVYVDLQRSIFDWVC